MKSTAFVLVVLLVICDLAAASAAPCKTNITISETSTATIFKPVTTVYDYGNITNTHSTDVVKAFKNVTSIPVTSVAASAHTSFGSTAITAKNATSTNYEEENTTSNLKTTILANAASTAAQPTTESLYLSATDVSETGTVNHESPATSQVSITISSYTLHSSDSPPSASASSKIVDMAAHSSQSAITSTTTQIMEITVTKTARITCTIGSSCLDNGASLSYTGSEERAFEITSSTMTRTVIVQTSAANSFSSTAVTPSSSIPITTSVEPSADVTKDAAPSNTSTLTTKGRLLNSTSVANVPAVSISSTILYTSSLLFSNSSIVPSTSLVVTTVPESLPPQTDSDPQTSTSTVVVTPIIVPITNTVTTSSSSPALNTNAAGKLQPPRAFGLLAALGGHLGRDKIKSAAIKLDSTTLYSPSAPRSEVISTTTVTPTKYITAATPSQCTEQDCIPSLGFKSAAGRLLPGPPFIISLFSSFFKVCADTTRLMTATTITVTIYRHQDYDTVTSTEVMSSTEKVSNNEEISSTKDVSSTSVLVSSCAPYCGLPGGIDAPGTTASSTFFSRPGSVPKPSMSSRPTGDAAGKEEKLGLVLLFLLMAWLL